MTNSLLDLSGTLRQLRHQRGWSLDAMARRVGVNKSTLSRWESGKTAPRRHELTAAIAALDIGPDLAQSLFEAAGQPPLVKDDVASPLVSGDLLRVLRLRRGWTQNEAARAARVPQGTLSKWERSEDWPAADRLHALCWVLKASREETALLTRGRFIPSFLPGARTDSAAIGILEARKQELVIQLQHGASDNVEFGLLQLEADAFRIARRDPKASDILLDAMRWQVMFYGSYHYDQTQFRYLLRRGHWYARSLKRENHHSLVTQRIVLLQKEAGLRRARGDDAGLRAIAGSFLSLLSQTHGALAPEYRSWIYMEGARTLASVREPDTMVVRRLISASFAQPRDDGELRSDEPTTVRYAAATYARMGRFDEATAMIERVMVGGFDTFDGYLLLARIAWAGDKRDAALGHLASAATLAQSSPALHDLFVVVDTVRNELITRYDQMPRRALR